jgi:hypothetical protein
MLQYYNVKDSIALANQLWWESTHRDSIRLADMMIFYNTKTAEEAENKAKEARNEKQFLSVFIIDNDKKKIKRNIWGAYISRYNYPYKSYYNFYTGTIGDSVYSNKMFNGYIYHKNRYTSIIKGQAYHTPNEFCTANIDAPWRAGGVGTMFSNNQAESKKIAAFVSTAVADLSELGWVNMDRFMGLPNLTALKPANPEKAHIVAIFKNYKCILGVSDDLNPYARSKGAPRVPRHEPITLIAYKVEDDKFFIGKIETTSSDAKTAPVMQEISSESLEKMLAGL